MSALVIVLSVSGLVVLLYAWVVSRSTRRLAHGSSPNDSTPDPDPSAAPEKSNRLRA
jgi:hypothetical protein